MQVTNERLFSIYAWWNLSRFSTLLINMVKTTISFRIRLWRSSKLFQNIHLDVVNEAVPWLHPPKFKRVLMAFLSVTPFSAFSCGMHGPFISSTQCWTNVSLGFRCLWGAGKRNRRKASILSVCAPIFVRRLYRISRHQWAMLIHFHQKESRCYSFRCHPRGILRVPSICQQE